MENKVCGNRWEKDFLIIAIGEAISEIGSYAVQFSLIWWIASKTSSPLMLALSGLLAFLPQLFLGPYWSACAVLGIRAVANVFYTPAIQSVIPMLVPKQGLIRANGWNQFMQSGALMLGPVLGAAMYAILPLPIILLSDLVGALVASISIGIIKIPELKREQHQAPNFAKEMKEGFSIFLQDKNF